MSRVPLPPALVAGSLAGVFALAFALAGRERGFGPIAGLLVPLELAADTVFTAGQHLCYGPRAARSPVRCVRWAWTNCAGAPRSAGSWPVCPAP